MLWQTEQKKKQYNIKFTIVKVNINLQSSVQV